MASETPDDLVSRRSKELLGVLSMDDSRARREQTTIKLRKKKREESRAKRRANHTASEAAVAAPGSLAPAPLTPAQKQEQQAQLQVMAQDPAAIRQLLVNMQSADDNLRLAAISHVRKLLSIEVNPPIQQVIDVGMIAVMVGLLQYTAVPKLQFEAAWALTNVASGNSTQTRCVVESGAIQHLVNLIMSAHDDVREQSIWALGNIAGDGPAYRNVVIQAGIIPPLLSVMTPKSRKSLLRNGTWTISNLCRGKPAASFQQVRHCLPVLAQMVNTDDKEVLTDACWALSYLSDGSNEKVQAVVMSGVTRRLVQLMSYDALSVQTPALRTIGNIVAGDDVQTDAVVAAGAIGKLAGLLTSDRRTIRKEAAWALSNITAGSAEQVGAVVSHGIVANIVHCMQHDDFEIRKECVWCVCNASHGGSAQDIMAIAAAGAIPALIGLLGVPDSRVVIVSLETLENILRVGEQYGEENGTLNPYVEVVELHDGVESLERLQHHAETNIFVKAKELLTQYLDAQPEDDEDEGVMPMTASDGTLAFGQGGGGLGAPLQLGGIGQGGLLGGVSPPPVPQAGLLGGQMGGQLGQGGLLGAGQPAQGGLLGVGQPAQGGLLGASGGLFAPTSGGLGLQ